MSEYFILKGTDQEQAGPYTMEQLRSMWDAGLITSNTMYWKDGMPAWSMLGTMLQNRPKIQPTSQMPVETGGKPYSQWVFAFLMLITLVFPIGGFLIGIIRVWEPAKRRQAGQMLGLSIFLLLIYVLFLF